MQSPQSSQPKESKEEVVATLELDALPQPQLTGHAWRQQGTMLICQSCPFEHTSYIAPDYQLYGINDEGHPMIKKLEF